MFNKLAEDQVRNYAKDLPIIKVKSSKGRFNRRCHQNSTHEALKRGHKKIAMCICIGNNETFIHFVNINKKGVFTDNTLGMWSKIYTYHFVRFIPKNDFYNIIDVFLEYQKELKSKMTFLVKTFSTIDF